MAEMLPAHQLACQQGFIMATSPKGAVQRWALFPIFISNTPPSGVMFAGGRKSVEWRQSCNYVGITRAGGVQKAGMGTGSVV